MAIKYLLDTNILSDLIKNPQGMVARRIREVGEAAICTSIVVSSELRFGAVKRGSERLTQQLASVLKALVVMPLESPVDKHYADIRACLEKAGTPIGPNDLLIAAHARSLGLVLVTANVREFKRVQNLEVQNWLR